MLVLSYDASEKKKMKLLMSNVVVLLFLLLGAFDVVSGRVSASEMGRQLSSDNGVACDACSGILGYLGSMTNKEIDLEMHRGSKADKPMLTKARLYHGDSCGQLCVDVTINPDNAEYIHYRQNKANKHSVKISGKNVADGKHDSFELKKEGGKNTGWGVCFDVPADKKQPYKVEIKTLAYDKNKNEVKTSATVDQVMDNLCLACTKELTGDNCPVDDSPASDQEECYPLKTDTTCSAVDDGNICDEINGHKYWHVRHNITKDDGEEQCSGKCVAEADLDYLLSTEGGYECGHCVTPETDDRDLNNPIPPVCYVVGSPPQLSSCTDDFVCDNVNGHTYYRMSHGDGPDCQSKCVAQSDVDFLHDNDGYNCGLCPGEFHSNCYDIDSPPVHPCNNDDDICANINHHKYYTMRLAGSTDGQTKCVAQSDVDFLRAAGYVCGSYEPDPDPICYDVNSPPDETCSNDDICFVLNDHTYYRMRPTYSTTDGQTKCVAQSDVDLLRDAGYVCGSYVPAPNVHIDNKVYLGHDNGASCGTDKAEDRVEGEENAAATYCFKVTNTGNMPLSQVTVVNTDVGFSQNLTETLAPGATKMIPVPRTILGELTNYVRVVAMPLNKDETESGSTVSHEDDSSVGVVAASIEALPPPTNPSVEIINTVYLGVSCGTDAAQKYVSAPVGTTVTYCFKVTNTGDTGLTNVVVTNADLSYNSTSNEIDQLDIGQTVIVTVTTTITGNLTNTATVTAKSPNDETVSDDDPSSVSEIVVPVPADVEAPPIPSVAINNTVYLGDDDGHSCGTDIVQERVSGPVGTTVTYCFEVTNTGDTGLTDVVVTNIGLVDFGIQEIDPLAIEGTNTISYTTTITGDLVNVAEVTARSLNYTTVSQFVADDDDSEVIGIVLPSSISIENTVYIGTDNGLSCNSLGVENVTGFHGDDVVYCFNVTNTGETTLVQVTVNNTDVGMDPDNSLGTLAPGESKLLPLPRTINGDLVNTAFVTGKPVGVDGTLLNVPEVTDDDTSEVAEKTALNGDVRNGNKKLYEPPVNSTNCIEDNWIESGSTEQLICSNNTVYVSSIAAETNMTCTVNTSITLTAEATVFIDREGFQLVTGDLGWYVATDGGLALTGTCAVNGLQAGNDYTVEQQSGGGGAGVVAWVGDGDVCGDVGHAGPVQMTFPLIVDTTIPCTDENEDGVLDVAICFTWRTFENNGNECSFATNIPAVAQGGCYCTRVDIPNIEVETPVDDPVAPC